MNTLNFTILNSILSKIKNKFNVIDKYYLDGYFLFDFGKDSVVHFKISNLNWQFGMWCIDNDDKGKDIYLFGEHIYMIDKFKPSQTAISFKFSLTKDQLDLISKENNITLNNDIINEFIQVISNIKSSPIKQYKLIYDVNTKHWFLDMLYFHIEKPIREFAKNNLNYIICKIIILFCNLIHGHSFVASLRDTSDVLPRYEIIFRHYTDNDDLIYTRYNKWFGKKQLIGFGKNIMIGHYYRDEKRSFYYK